MPCRYCQRIPVLACKIACLKVCVIVLCVLCAVEKDRPDKQGIWHDVLLYNNKIQ